LQAAAINSPTLAATTPQIIYKTVRYHYRKTQAMRKFIGIIIIVFALFWVWYYGSMVVDEFLYSHVIIFCFHPPIWVSILNSILASIGLIVGIKIFKNSLRNWIALFTLISILIVGFLLDYFGYSIM